MKKTNILFALLAKMAKDHFYEKEDSPLKKVILKEILEDSKNLIIAICVLNSAIVFLVFSIVLLAFGLKTQSGPFDQQWLLLCSGSFFIISVTIVGLTVLYLTKRSKRYKNVIEIKKNLTKPNVFSSLINQLKIENSKMKALKKNQPL